MKLLCPACRTPLPEAAVAAGGPAVLACPSCQAEVDLSRASTAAGRPRFVPEPDRAGEVVGGYRLEERLGAGGMGTVYRAAAADADRLPRAVAIKFLTPALAGEPQVVARFHREVAMMAALDHPAIVRVLDHGDHQGAPWLAMELVAGTDLRRRLDAAGPLGLAEVNAIFLPLFAALGHAHQRGVIHRDLKPANVLLAGEAVKLADFGVARLGEDGDGAATQAATRLTATAAVLGTLPYMSPEQRAGRALDRRSDLFSMGVMLYEAITGSLPQGAFPPASSLNRAFPARVDAVVARLLRPAPADRYPTAGEAAEALRRALAPAWGRRLAAAAAGGVAATVAFVLAMGPSTTTKQALQKARVEPAPAAIVPAPAPSPPPAQQAAPQAQGVRLPARPASLPTQSQPAPTTKGAVNLKAGGKPKPASTGSRAKKSKKALDSNIDEPMFKK
jgi:serine/threonine protein kinase